MLPFTIFLPLCLPVPPPGEKLHKDRVTAWLILQVDLIT